MKKKLLNVWRSLAMRWIKPTGESSFCLQVMAINSGTDNLLNGLGITSERADELVNSLRKCYNNSRDITEAMQKHSKICLHANELFFSSYVLAKEHDSNNSNPIGQLLQMFMEEKRKKK